MRFFVTQLADWQGDGFADLDGKPLGEQPPTEQPEALIVTSSAEIGVLRSPRAQAILARAGAARIALHSFVSVGCAGVFAALFEARRLGVKSARILALEAPRAHVQARLDAAGLQYFEAQETACVMDLSCQPVGLALPIGHCEILARPDTMAAPPRWPPGSPNGCASTRAPSPACRWWISRTPRIGPAGWPIWSGCICPPLPQAGLARWKPTGATT